MSSELSSQQLLWLLAGLPVVKQGRNGRPYRRLLRLAPDGQALEWLRLGPGAASQMSLADASVETESEERDRRDGSCSTQAHRVTVQGRGRVLTLEIEKTEEHLWVEALRAQLESPGGESPLKLRNKFPTGKPVASPAQRKTIPTILLLIKNTLPPAWQAGTGFRPPCTRRA